MATFVSLELLLNSDTELGPLILSPFFSFLLFFPSLPFPFLSFPVHLSLLAPIQPATDIP